MELFLLFMLAETTIYLGILSLKLYFEVVYNRTAPNDELIIKILIFKSVVLYRMCIPAIQFKTYTDTFLPWIEAQIASQDDSNTPNHPIETHVKREQKFIRKSIALFALYPQRLGRFLHTFFDWLSIYKSFMQKIVRALRCEYLTWHSACGTGDAATTALVTGFLWSVKGNVLKHIKNTSALTLAPEISIKPEWERKAFSTTFKCIFSIRIGHVITAVVKALLRRDCHKLKQC